MPLPGFTHRISTSLVSRFSLLLSSFLLLLPLPAAEPLSIAAAADLSPLQTQLAQSITQATGIPVRFTFGGSGILARQIENGAPFDLYLSANEGFLRDLEKVGKLVAGSAATYATGRLGLWSKSGRFRAVPDLTGAGVVHVALPNPAHAPYGAAARELLRGLGLWTKVEPKVVYGENVQQALQYAESGNADACITAWSLVRDKGGILLPAGGHPPIRQVGALVSGSRRQAEAGKVLAFLLSPAGKALLEAHGFGAVR